MKYICEDMGYNYLVSVADVMPHEETRCTFLHGTFSHILFLTSLTGSSPYTV